MRRIDQHHKLQIIERQMQAGNDVNAAAFFEGNGLCWARGSSEYSMGPVLDIDVNVCSACGGPMNTARPGY